MIYVADGVIKILTELDKTGFTKGLNELKSSTANATEQMNSAFMAVGVTLATLATTVGTAGFIYDQSMENAQAAFTVLLGSADKAKAKLVELEKFANETPFDLPGVSKAAKTLLAYGTTAEDLMPTLKTLGDISLGNEANFQSLALAFGQVEAKGHLAGQEALQMVNVGFSPLQEISKKTGETMEEVSKRMEQGAISTAEVKQAMIDSTSEGGRFSGAMGEYAKTFQGRWSTAMDAFGKMSGQVIKPTFNFIRDKLLPSVTDLMGKITQKISTTNWEQVGKTIKGVGDAFLMATVAMASFKIGTILDALVVSFKSAQAVAMAYTVASNAMSAGQILLGMTMSTNQIIIGVLTGQINLATASTLLWEKAVRVMNLAWQTNPIGIVVTIVATLATGLLILAGNMDKVSDSVGKTMTSAFDDFTNTVVNAKSKLDEFSGAFSAYDAKGAEIQKSIEEVQAGITAITSLATQERRALTDSEIAKLDEYFQKLNTLEEQELQIMEAKRQAVQTITQTILDNLALSAEEYKIKGAEMLATQQDIDQQTLDQIDKARVNEIAALNLKFGDQANLSNQAYVTQLASINTNFDNQKKAVADGLSKQWSQYVEGYAKLIGVEEDYNKKVTVVLSDRLGGYSVSHVSLEDEMTRHTDSLNSINTAYANDEGKRNSEIEQENKQHNVNMGTIWLELTKGLDDTKKRQLTTLIGMVADASSKGAEVKGKYGDLVTGAVSELNKLPSGTKTAMQNAMQPLIDTIENKKPTILQRITTLGREILSSLNKAMGNASPSKKTRKIFQNVMLGMMVGMDSEERNLFNKVDNLFKRLNSTMNLNAMKIESNLSTGDIYNRAYNTIPVNVNGTYTSNIELDGNLLAVSLDQINSRRTLQYGY